MKNLLNEDLFELLKNKSSLIVKVVNANELNEETYGTNGMIGVISKMTIYDEFEDNDKVYKMDINWIEYSENNIPLESHDWYLPNGEGLGTMKEAKFFPNSGVETLFCTSTLPSGLEIIDQDNSKLKIFQMWKDSDNTLNYTEWLESIAIKTLVNGEIL
jgi:hypothetical protein